MAAQREESAGTAERPPEDTGHAPDIGRRERRRECDLMILVAFQVAIALTLVPATEQANKLKGLWMALLLAVVFGAMELLCFKLLWMGLGNLARASRMVGANDPG